jgi:hypothetical protein
MIGHGVKGCSELHYPKQTHPAALTSQQICIAECLELTNSTNLIVPPGPCKTDFRMAMSEYVSFAM